MKNRPLITVLLFLVTLICLSFLVRWGVQGVHVAMETEIERRIPVGTLVSAGVMVGLWKILGDMSVLSYTMLLMGGAFVLLDTFSKDTEASEFFRRVGRYAAMTLMFTLVMYSLYLFLYFFSLGKSELSSGFLMLAVISFALLLRSFLSPQILITGQSPTPFGIGTRALPERSMRDSVTEEEYYNVCIHEAGHAIMNAVYGIDTIRRQKLKVIMRASGNSFARTECVISVGYRSQKHLLAEAMVAVAGMEANRVTSGQYWSGNRGDNENLRRLYGFAASEFPDGLKSEMQLRQDVYDFLSLNEDVLLEAADMLMQNEVVYIADMPLEQIVFTDAVQPLKAGEWMEGKIRLPMS